MHQQPTYRIVDNLRFTRDGIVWADYLVSGLKYGYNTKADKDVVRSAHKMMWRALPGESMLAGLCVTLDPGAITDLMMKDVDWENRPQWVAECDATWDTLDEIKPGSRVFWLSVPLANLNWRDRARAITTAAVVSITDMTGAPRGPVNLAEIRRRKLQSDRLVKSIPAFFNPRPATPAQMVWFHGHCATRGLGIDANIPDPDTDTMQRPQAALSPLRIDEGAQSDIAAAAAAEILDGGGSFGGRLARSLGTALRPRVPSLEKVVKVDQPWIDSTPSYQTFLALANTPSGDTQFPGSEIFTLADDLPGVSVDWVIRSRVRARDEVIQKNRRALVNLNDQYLQREHELVAGVSALDRAAAAMADYATEIESNEQEVEVEATALFAVGGSSAAEAVDSAQDLSKLFEVSGYELQCPLGYQEELFWAMYPGAASSKIVEQYAQLTTSHHFSAWVPITAAELGDSHGSLFALNITTNRPGLVFVNSAGSSERDVSGSAAFVCELGGGKSVAMKSLAGAEVDRGAQLVCVDRTEMGEYELWASTVADARVVDLAAPRYSIDPMRMFPGQLGGEMALSLLLRLLHVQPDSTAGAMLSNILEPQYRADHDLTSIPRVSQHVKTLNSPAAQTLSEKFSVYETKSFSRALFDPDLPALDPRSAAIVFRTHKLKLPRQSELEKAHLYESLELEKRVGRVLYTYLARLARAICFADRDRLAIWLLDECHHITGQEEGSDEVEEFVRDGRKHNAAVYLGTHDPDDIGSETLRGLIPNRIVMRQRDETLARKSMAWLGANANDPALIKELREDTSPITGKDRFVEPHRRGEGYKRDAAGDIGRIKVLAPSEPRRRTAVMTTPKRRDLAGASS